MQEFKAPKNFYEKRIVAGDCWEWSGTYFYPKRSPNGYGITYFSGIKKYTSVHRISWMLFNKEFIPLGMVIMHTCDNTKCYNPNHLILGSQKDNVQDMLDKRRLNPKFGFKSNEYYPHGHKYEGNNLIIRLYKDRGDQRRCRACRRLQYQAHLKRLQEVIQ